MPDPLIDRDELNAVLRLVESQAEAYLSEVDDALVRPPGVASLDSGPPANGTSSLRAMSELISASIEGATRSGGLVSFTSSWEGSHRPRWAQTGSRRPSTRSLTAG